MFLNQINLLPKFYERNQVVKLLRLHNGRKFFSCSCFYRINSILFVVLRNKIKMASESNSQSGSQRSEHEKLYSPSEWSKRFGPDEVSDATVLTILLN